MIDLTILMDTTVGRPADMLEAVSKSGVQVVAGCLFPRLGGRVAHVAVRPEDVAKVRQAVVEHGGTVADERECVVVPPDYQGGIAAASRALADAAVMVNVAYFGLAGQMIIATSDVALTRSTLGLE